MFNVESHKGQKLRLKPDTNKSRDKNIGESNAAKEREESHCKQIAQQH